MLLLVTHSDEPVIDCSIVLDMAVRAGLFRWHQNGAETWKRRKSQQCEEPKDSSKQRGQQVQRPCGGEEPGMFEGKKGGQCSL